MEISTGGIDLIKKFEGVKHNAYQDSVGVWTIGCGHTRGVAPGDKCSMSQVDAFLREDLDEAEKALETLVKVKLNQNQYDALVSFVFNLGWGNFQKSTLLKKLNRGDYDGAAIEFPKWNKAGGKVLKGLTNRRLAEQKLFLKPIGLEI